MIIGPKRFNIYLLCLVALAAATGCQTSKKPEKALATLRLHLEVVPQSMDFSTQVPVYRARPVMVTVDKSPFLTEINLTSAKVVDVMGGFDLQIQFDRQGSWILEEYTTTNPGKHLAIFSTFAFQDKKEGRWLGAPVISRRISNGLLTFTPDASREEAEAIALELNNAAKKNKDESKW
jgi:preprotein translocase subunit SecD